ncbi:GerMN domain-containing protein [Halobacillus salinarum]|uniref:GerMN domain-containing protein n=1 Tax=Halobacillus salinarum TaxID=2932257 RepID=A0ABY4EQR6_9BACI|nr:GerMN domain-containing protein [Halobacillus salinarum]UOQ46218.1 GerMN domain-containing protein [Halobacillus salinarum]
MKSLGIKPLSIAVLLSTGLLSGCFFEGEQSLEKMDTPPENTSVDSKSDSDSSTVKDNENAEGESADKTTARDIYLFDSNGMVVPQTLQLPQSKEVAAQALEYMVQDGPVTELLPQGFQAVLPAGTEIKGVNLKEDGTLVVDVSKEFEGYTAENEEKILQAMTFTLTQFDNVDRIKLWINGHEQATMPVNGTPISEGVSRTNGINIQVGEQTDVVNSKAVTVYFPSQNDQQVYEVPVTTRVNKSDNVYQSVVNALLDGPELGTSLLQPFNEEAELLGADLKEGVLTLTFNKGILNGQEPQAIGEEALSSLVLTLTDMEDVEAVQVKVDGVDEVFNEAGETLDKPVTRADLSEEKSV